MLWKDAAIRAMIINPELYEATLQIALRDLDTICKLLELREQRTPEADPDPFGVLDALDAALKIK